MSTAMPCASDEHAQRHDDRDHHRDRGHATHASDGSYGGMQAVSTSVGPGESCHG